MNHNSNDSIAQDSAKRQKARRFVSGRTRRLSLCFSAVIIAFVMIAGGQSRAAADNPPGLSGLVVAQFDCSSFAFQASGPDVSGYAAVRIWVNSPSGTALVDSYNAGYPGFYASFGSPNYAAGAVTFATQPVGTKLYARVYRALSTIPGSWDGGQFVDRTITCGNGINSLWYPHLTCSTFEFDAAGYPYFGYAGLRIWINNPNGTALIDSYATYSSDAYVAIPASGAFSGTVSFAAQPSGTTLYARLYRALQAAPGSWDGGSYTDYSQQCQLYPQNVPDKIGVYRPSASVFLFRDNLTTGWPDYTTGFGNANSLPVVGDWNGDGIDTAGSFDSTNGSFSLTDITSPNPPPTYSVFVLGNPGDMPLAGRWFNFMTRDGVGVFRPSNGLTYLRANPTTGYADVTMVFGIPGDQGIVGDWRNAYGIDSPGVYRPSNNTFYMTNQVCNCSAVALYQVTFGSGGNGALAFAGNWTGYGDAVGLFQNGTVSLKDFPYSGSTADTTFTYGTAGDIPVMGHWGVPLNPATTPITSPLAAAPLLVAPTFVPAPTHTAPSRGVGD